MYPIKLSGLIAILSCCYLGAHETFFRPEKYKIRVDEPLKIKIFTGSFDGSVFPMPPHKVKSLKLHTAAQSSELDSDGWLPIEKGSYVWRFSQRVAAKLGRMDSRESSSYLFSTSEEGTHIIGLELTPSRIGMEKPKYQSYLDNEAHLVFDLDKLGFTEPDDIVIESYTKIAKTIIQVGKKTTDNVTQPIGQKVEIVPLTHPAEIKKGDTLSLKIFHDGVPLINHPLSVGRNAGALKLSIDTIEVHKSDESGIVTFPITHSGIWWANFIYIQTLPDNETMDFASHWATLNFRIQ